MTSLDAPGLDVFRDLQSREASDAFVIEGELAVTRLLQASPAWEVAYVLATASRAQRLRPLLSAGTQLLELSHAQFRELTGFDFHRGALACARRQEGRGSAKLARSSTFLGVCVHGLADPSNIGAIARNAMALGADAIFYDLGGADPFSRRAIRASAGWSLQLPFASYEDAGELFAELASSAGAGEGLEVWAAALGPDSEPLSRPEVPARLLLVLGNEGDGLAPELLAHCDRRIHIPMARGVDSLNVAAASAVLLHALRPG